MDDRLDKISPVARAFAMMNPRKSLGVMRPLGGGDEIPLKKEELVLGRRPTCDIRLDFENISGKHCLLKFVGGTWHVRDLDRKSVV